MSKLSTLSYLKRIFKPFFGFLLMIPITLLLSPILLCLWIYSRIVFLLIWLKFGSNWSKPNGQDISLGIGHENSKPYVTICHSFKGKADVPAFVEKFDTVLNEKNEKGEFKYERLKQVFENHYGFDIFRTDPNFDIRNHVKIFTLPELFPELVKGGTDLEIKSNKEYRVLGDSDLDYLPDIPLEKAWERLFEKLDSEEFEPGRPQWWIIFLEEKGNYFSYVWRFHHAVTDGLNYTLFFKKIIEEPSVSYEKPIREKKLKKFWDNLWAFSMLPYIGPVVFHGFKDNPLHGPDLCGEKIFVQSKPIDSDVLKQVRKEMNVNMTAILLTCFSNALRANFKSKNAKVDEIQIYTTESGHQDITQPVQLRNLFSLLAIKLKIFNECAEGEKFASVLDRVQSVQKSVSEAKSNPAFAAVYWLVMNTFGIIPTFLISYVFNGRGYTACYSNFPFGPKARAFGSEQVAVNGSLMDRTPMGIGILTVGYLNEIRIGLNFDKVLISSKERAQEFLDNFLEEYKNIEKESLFLSNSDSKIKNGDAKFFFKRDEK